MPFCIGIALLLHLLIGWPYAIVGAVVAGALFKEHSVMAGVWTLVATWGGLVIYSFAVATEETTNMVTVVAALIGDLPPIMTVVLTIGIAAILGAIGGWLGSVPLKKNQH